MSARAPASGDTCKEDESLRETEPSVKECEDTEEERTDCSSVNNNYSVYSHWGYSLQDIFRLALKFFKEMNGKAFNPTYEENLLFVALQKQIFIGPYNPDDCPDVGFFDVLGNDRRKKWAELGCTSKEDAMEDFVKLLNSCCSLFSPYVTSHKIEKEEHERRVREEEERLRLEREQQCRREEEQRLEDEKRRQEAERLLSFQQKEQVILALNAQTPVQLKKNAEARSSENTPQQHLLIQSHEQLHYPECIQQGHSTQNAKQDPADTPSPDSNDMVSVTSGQSEPLSSKRKKSEANPKQYHLFIESKPGEMPMMAPSMWTTPEVNEFKQKTQRDAQSVITVGRGEVLTVHIPTHADGSTFFWEFATDCYDIAFGLYFEWPNPEKYVEAVSENHNAGHAEEANGKSGKIRSTLPQVSEVVPLFRRDSHENVYAGSHEYPSQGVYLLRFDNSYSLWRSKVVYYRVYYTS